MTATDGELYITFLMQGPNGNRLNGGVYINGSTLQEFGALRTQYNTSGNNSSPNAPHVFFDGRVKVAVSNPVTTTTYMYVQKYTGLGSASGGTAQLWLIDSRSGSSSAATPTRMSSAASTSTSSWSPRHNGRHRLHTWRWHVAGH